MHHARHRAPITGGEEARRDWADQQWFADGQAVFIAAHLGVQGDAARFHLPAGQVVRQTEGNFCFALGVGHHGGVPVGGVLELLADCVAGEIAATTAKTQCHFLRQLTLAGDDEAKRRTNG